MMRTTQPLFRPEVFAKRRAHWLAPIRLTLPVPYRALACAAVVILALLVGALFLGEHTRRIRVEGQLVPEQGLLSIHAAQAGTVARAIVQEGELVAEGQPLLEISTDVDSAAMGGTRAAIANELGSQRSRLETEIDAKERLARLASDELESRVGTAVEQLAQIDQQLAIQSELVESSRKLLERIRPLENRGYISVAQVQQQRVAALNAEADLLTLRRQRSDKQEQLNALRGQQKELPLSTASQVSELRRKLAENQAAAVANEAQRAVVLRAPHSGEVVNLAVFEGQAVAAGQRVLNLVPKDSALLAQLWVPSDAAGNVRPGIRVAIRYRAFPYEKYGIQYGTIAQFSPSVILPDEIMALFGLKKDEPQFRAMVQLDRQEIASMPRSLKSGMLFDADILLEQERLIDWILGPLYRTPSDATHA
jgi:membrane fusion protein